MLRWIAVGLVLVALVGCKPRQPFLGTWKSGQFTISFNSNGTMLAGSEGGTQTGKWREAGSGELETQADGFPTPGKTRWQVSEDGKALIVTNMNPDGTAGESRTYTKE